MVALRTGQRQIAQEMGVHLPNGEVRWLRVNAVPLPAGSAGAVMVTFTDISALMNQSRELQESRERFELALEGADAGMWDWDVVTGEVWRSRRFYTMLGYLPGDIGPKVEDWESLIHPEDLARVRQTVEDYLKGQTPRYQLEHRLRTASGEYRWILSIGALSRDSQGKARRMLGWHIDVHEQKRRNFLFEQMTTAIEEVFWMTDPEKKAMIYISPAYERIWGRTLRSLDENPRSFIDAIHADDHPELFRFLTEQTQRPSRVRYRVVRPDGSIRWVEDRGYPVFDSDNKVTLVAGSAKDITEQVEAERELEKERLRAFSSSKMSSLGEMAGGIAHEINNPLAVILGKAGQLLELLKRPEPDLQLIHQGVERIAITADRIAKIIRGLRAFARDAGQDPMEPASVNQVVTDTLALCEARFRHRGVQLEVEPIAAELRILCRPTQIAQVLLNLLSNSFDAVSDTPDSWVKVSARQEGDRVLLSVTDSGKGVPASIRARIMEPFFTTKGVGKGTGLGLSLSRGLIEAHQGRLWLDENSPNTRFVMDLPAPAAVKNPTLSGDRGGT
jgi:PAS domain S-box-containing protein